MDKFGDDSRCLARIIVINNDEVIGTYSFDSREKFRKLYSSYKKPMLSDLKAGAKFTFGRDDVFMVVNFHEHIPKPCKYCYVLISSEISKSDVNTLFGTDEDCEVKVIHA